MTIINTILDDGYDKFYRQFKPEYEISVASGPFPTIAKFLIPGMKILIPKGRAMIPHTVVEVSCVMGYVVPCARHRYGKFAEDAACLGCSTLMTCVEASRAYRAMTARVLEHSW